MILKIALLAIGWAVMPAILSCSHETNAQVIEKGLELPNGFVARRVAGDELATNIYCLNVSPNGHVFVSGPGYIKRLLDLDGDGVFDESELFAAFPKSGAQGIWTDHTRLLCIGDGGLWEFSDADRNGVADGPPTKQITFTTGQEHSAHAIRRGPDGWFYVLCGNATKILPEYTNSALSPVKNVEAGFLMRCSPDFKQMEVVAHGFRNAYDFDFDRDGQIFVYDSDGERDISLPWYRPTRVFQIQPGDHAGWISRGWKRPSTFFDMPIEVGALGRGSPTGVEVYRGDQFPEAYDGSLLVADWTFGRIVAFQRSGDGYQAADFAIAKGQFGFAVTDLAIGPNGNLLVSVGGRGTSGAIYEISYNGRDGKINSPENVFRPAVNKRPDFNRRVFDQEQRQLVFEQLDDDDPMTRQAALSSLIGRVSNWKLDHPDSRDEFVESIFSRLENFNRREAKLFLRMLETVDLNWTEMPGFDKLPIVSQLLLRLSSQTPGHVDPDLILSVANSLNSEKNNRLEMCRIGQLAVGGGAKKGPEMFRGYTSRFNPELDLNQRKRLADLLASSIQRADLDGEIELAMETGRLAAQLRVDSSAIEKVIVSCLIDCPTPIGKIHWLNCLACTGSQIEDPAISNVAHALVGLDREIEGLELETDRNWVPRMRELAARLFEKNPKLATEVAKLLDGREGQVYLFDELPNVAKREAIQSFVSKVDRDLESATPNQLRIVAGIGSPEALELLKKAVEIKSLRPTALLAICLNWQSFDRQYFLDAIQERDLPIVKQAAIAMRREGSRLKPLELIQIWTAAERLGWSNPEISVRDQIIMLLQDQLDGSTYGYEYRTKGKDQSVAMNRWQAYLREKFSKEYSQLGASQDATPLSARLAGVDWEQGDANRGAKLYKDLTCAQCHDGGSRLGPRLEGVSIRFNRADLFKTIIQPSKQVSDRYRAMIVETVDGQLIKGIPIYESVDGITIQSVNGETIRINRADIEAKTRSNQSLMPEGLIDKLDEKELADLYQYLKAL